MNHQEPAAHLHAAAREEVRRALRASFPANSPLMLEEYGDALTTEAEALDIPIEELIRWIHDKPADKDFTLYGWRAWCARYVSERNAGKEQQL